jgi:hypothetical protein
LLKRGLEGVAHVDGEALLGLMDRDQTGPTDASPLPVLGFRITNTTEDTIVVDRLRLAVRESRIDRRPLPWSSSMHRHTNGVINASFLLGNDGWGSADNIRYAFDIVGESALAEAGGKTERRFFQEIAAVGAGGAQVVSFWADLAAFGKDISFLRDGPHPSDDKAAMARFARDVAALRAGIGAAPDERIYTIGELSYAWGDGNRSRLALRQQLQIVYPGLLAAPAMLATAEYEIELRPEGRNYTVDRPIAHSIAPGEAEAIDLRVWVEKSSRHDMTAAIRVGEAWIESSDALRLEYYRPFHSGWEGRAQP